MMSNSSEYKDYREYAKLIFMVRKDDIIHYVVKKDCLITLEDIKEHLVYFEKKYAGKKFLNIYEFLENAEIDDDARKWASDPSGNNYTIADAFVIQSMAQKLLGNFYMTFHKPVKPTKLFNNLEEALSWLKSLR